MDFLERFCIGLVSIIIFVVLLQLTGKSVGSSGTCMEDVKVMCWNELTQAPRECR